MISNSGGNKLRRIVIALPCSVSGDVLAPIIESCGDEKVVSSYSAAL